MVYLMHESKRNYFDFVYEDGSHSAPDVLRDLILAFELCRIGGIVAMDDYLWCRQQAGSQDLQSMPKLAIDRFVNLYLRKLRILMAPMRQFYIQKLSN